MCIHIILHVLLAQMHARGDNQSITGHVHTYIRSTLKASAWLGSCILIDKETPLA